MSVLQKQFPENFYVIALSQENPETVKRFLKKNKTDLAVAIDYEGEAFKKYNINSLPQAVLLNAHGTVLWKGHPADLKTYHLSDFLRQNTECIEFKNLFEIQNLVGPISEIKYRPKHDFEFYEIPNTEFTPIEVIRNDTFLEIKGSLQDIFAYAFKVYKGQILIDPDLNKTYQMYFKTGWSTDEKMGQTICKALNLNLNTTKARDNAIVLSLGKSQFWGTQQINWGVDAPKYLIGNSQLQADNVSLVDLSYKLANLLEIPIVTTSGYDNHREHDWQIHYKYFDLMQADLMDNYGVKAEKELSDYLQYIISKK